MKISVIGAGQVGSTAALLMGQRELGEIVLLDIPKMEDMPKGKALDLSEARPIERFDAQISGGTDPAIISGSDLVVVTSGKPRTPDMTRMDLVNINGDIIKSVTENIVKHAPNALILMVANPLDVMCYVARKVCGWPRNRVFGQAGVLDSARFRFFIADELKVSVEDVHAMVLGGHGDSMVPLRSCATVSGVPVSQLISSERFEQLIQRTRDGGAEIVKLLKTGSAYYAPGAAVAQMAESIVKDKRRLLPTTCWLEGEFGLHDVYAGVPAILGKNGVEKIVEVQLTDAERAALHKSAQDVKDGIAEWEKGQ